mgnify:CR=1 FL=1
MTHNEEEYLEFLNNLPSNFRVMPHALRVGLHEEYMQFDTSIAEHLEEIDELTAALYDVNSSIDLKKAIIIELAHAGEVAALQTLQAYTETAPEELQEWLQLATHECQMYLESDLLDENIVMISGGIGGEGHRMRYFMALIAQQTCSTSPDITNLVRTEFETIAQKNDSIIESFEVEEQFYKFMMLIPMNVPLDQFITTGIEEINNTLPNYLHNTYMLTNVAIPPNEHLVEFAQEVRNRKEED